jgi:ABC-2 type transport system ATP-binding protein
MLLTTHFMDEAERLADRIAIIDGGTLLALDTPSGLMRGQSTTTTDVTFTTSAEVDTFALGRLVGARTVRRDASGSYTVESGDPRALLVELTTYMRDKRVDLAELRVGRSSLEDVFLQLTGKEVRD